MNYQHGEAVIVSLGIPSIAAAAAGADISQVLLD